MSKTTTTFYLIRHGDNDWLPRGLAGRIPGVSLNANGLAQAQALAHRLSSINFNRIYASPLERAQETAAPLAKATGLELRIAPELHEVDFGVWNGATFETLHADPRWSEWCRNRSVYRIPKGELMTDVQARMNTLLTRLHEETPGATIALFSHGDAIRAALCYYLSTPIDQLPRIEILPASISILSLGPSGPMVHRLNGTI